VIAVFWGAEEMDICSDICRPPTVLWNRLRSDKSRYVGNGKNGDFIIWTNQNDELVANVQKIGQENNANWNTEKA
jgi:hypothetical protein